MRVAEASGCCNPVRTTPWCVTSPTPGPTRRPAHGDEAFEDIMKGRIITYCTTRVWIWGYKYYVYTFERGGSNINQKSVSDLGNHCKPGGPPISGNFQHEFTNWPGIQSETCKLISSRKIIFQKPSKSLTPHFLGIQVSFQADSLHELPRCDYCHILP